MTKEELEKARKAYQEWNITFEELTDLTYSTVINNTYTSLFWNK